MNRRVATTRTRTARLTSPDQLPTSKPSSSWELTSAETRRTSSTGSARSAGLVRASSSRAQSSTGFENCEKSHGLPVHADVGLSKISPDSFRMYSRRCASSCATREE